MNIDKFAFNNRIKRKTVEDWIKKGLIPNADLEKNFVPDSARPPFTKARAKNVNSIYVSMVRASFERKHILPILYKICEDEFNGYIERLVLAGCIEKRVSDGVTYYDATIQSKDINSNYILKSLKAIFCGISEGTTTAILNKLGA